MLSCHFFPSLFFPTPIIAEQPLKGGRIISPKRYVNLLKNRKWETINDKTIDDTGESRAGQAVLYLYN